ncbi:MAG: hypothetical protein H6563_14540 [Lewinellaceae bacterium]|nr:hypothetical protein [Lewinellaceae bacterium]
MANRHTPRIGWFLAAGAVLLLFAFQVPTLTPLVQKELDKRLQDYREEVWRACRKRALELASKEVDSLVIEWAKANRDTFNRPAKPEKPLEPERLLPKDTTPVAPLFNEQDTLKD